MPTNDFPLSSLDLPIRPLDPVQWWRVPCPLPGNRLFMSGGISMNEATARIQLAEWEAAGITDYMPVHIEFNEQKYIEKFSNIRVHHIGVHDDLGRRDSSWFDAVTTCADKVLANSDAVLMVTCWVGCNRGPSATFAIILSQGWDVLPALCAIRTARPIAAMTYAPDAAEWWAMKNGGDYNDAIAASNDVKRWFDRNPLDARWVIGEIDRFYFD
jgi:hypothetical protein